MLVFEAALSSTIALKGYKGTLLQNALYRRPRNPVSALVAKRLGYGWERSGAAALDNTVRDA
jgi:hypothetical protein